jgi:ssRNA-specific RNase YbeY (16S rRNA maturation enzyme)
MQELNKELRGQGYTPAVLSFPYFERILLEKQGSRRSRGSYSDHKVENKVLEPKARGSYFEPTEEGMLLGEVLICKTEAKKLAKRSKVTEDEQISGLIVHGIKQILNIHEGKR